MINRRHNLFAERSIIVLYNTLLRYNTLFRTFCKTYKIQNINAFKNLKIVWEKLNWYLHVKMKNLF